MYPAIKARLFRFSFLLNAFIFFVGGLGLMEDGKTALALIQFVTALGNLFMLVKKLSPTKRTKLNYIILTLNILVALSIALDYYAMGKDKIKYLWFLAAFIYALALFVQIRKNNSAALNQ